jgi:hypothetical protein
MLYHNEAYHPPAKPKLSFLPGLRARALARVRFRSDLVAAADLDHDSSDNNIARP